MLTLNCTSDVCREVSNDFTDMFLLTYFNSYVCGNSFLNLIPAAYEVGDVHLDSVYDYIGPNYCTCIGSNFRQFISRTSVEMSVRVN